MRLLRRGSEEGMESGRVGEGLGEGRGREGKRGWVDGVGLRTSFLSFKFVDALFTSFTAS